MNQITLRSGHERRVRTSHPWIFSNEISSVQEGTMPGDCVEVYGHSGQFYGMAYYNPHSLISARILTTQRESIDTVEFFESRLKTALEYRRETYGDLNAVRLVHGEGDQLPGLVVDRYGDVLSVQFLTLGIEKRREVIAQALKNVLNPSAIVARNDTGVRELEGLPQSVEVLFGELPERIIVNEHGLQFKVDILAGQKTGHFLDQKENHAALEGRVNQARVLDLFCYSGSWSIHAARYGAKEVTGVDISAGAVALAEENARLNYKEGVCSFVQADVFDFLREQAQAGERYDTVVLDPPAFVKSKKKLQEAVRGYLTVNRRAMELVKPGGYLFTCSCSYHMQHDLFLDTIRKAALKAGRTVRLIEMRGQSLDHPVLLNCPETEYLKCAVLQIL